MSLIKFDELQRRKSEIPIITDKIFMDFVNLIQVNDDLISFRQKQGLFGQLFDRLTGADRMRQLATDKNVNEAMKAFRKLVLDFSDQLDVSHNAINLVEEKLIEIRNVIHNHRYDISLLQESFQSQQQQINLLIDNFNQLQYEVKDLKHQIQRSQVQHKIEDAIAAWQSKQTYQGFDWAIQVAFVTREIIDYALGDYERLITKDKDNQLRQSISNRILKTENIIPDHHFRLTNFLNLSYSKTSPDNRELAGYLLEVESISEQRIAKMPYLFTLGKTLELAQQQQHQDPAKAAFDLYLRYPNARIYAATSKREFVERIVNETANDRLNTRDKLEQLSPPTQTLRINNIATKQLVINQPKINQPKNETNETSRNQQTTTSTIKIGLILAGGGAKGAYQSGVVKYLAEVDFAPHIIAGTSIGALNGAILASNTSFKQSSDRLWQLWKELGETNIIKFQPAKYSLHSLAQYLLLSGEDASLCDSKPLDKFLHDAVNAKQLRKGIELWVAAFPSAHNFLPHTHKAGQIVPTIGNVITATLGQSAEYIHVQSAPTDEEIYQTLLASAAIPLAFKSRKIDGKHYVDGWLGDNVPLKALANRGCTHAIIIHLENGSLWNRHEFPNQTIIEIRPTETIDNFANIPIIKDLTTMLDFSPERIQLLQQRGYEDAKRILEPILQTLIIERSRKESFARLQETTERLRDDPPIY
jgi:NTE family protein